LVHMSIKLHFPFIAEHKYSRTNVSPNLDMLNIIVACIPVKNMTTVSSIQKIASFLPSIFSKCFVLGARTLATKFYKHPKKEEIIFQVNILAIYVNFVNFDQHYSNYIHD
ncbi:hypothetical protein ACJX0J_039606, partial [Zea mays]